MNTKSKQNDYTFLKCISIFIIMFLITNNKYIIYMIEVKIFCFLFGFFMIIVLLKWPCFEKFTSEFIYNRDKCPQCCTQLQTKEQCKKKCIFNGEICDCCK